MKILKSKTYKPSEVQYADCAISKLKMCLHKQVTGANLSGLSLAFSSEHGYARVRNVTKLSFHGG